MSMYPYNIYTNNKFGYLDANNIILFKKIKT